MASGAVAVWTGGQMVLLGAGLIVFGAALALTSGASFGAWIFGQLKKSKLLTDWKEWKEWFHRMGKQAKSFKISLSERNVSGFVLSSD